MVGDYFSLQNFQEGPLKKVWPRMSRRGKIRTRKEEKTECWLSQADETLWGCLLCTLISKFSPCNIFRVHDNTVLALWKCQSVLPWCAMTHEELIEMHSPIDAQGSFPQPRQWSLSLDSLGRGRTQAKITMGQSLSQTVAWPESMCPNKYAIPHW